MLFLRFVFWFCFLFLWVFLVHVPQRGLWSVAVLGFVELCWLGFCLVLACRFSSIPLSRQTGCVSASVWRSVCEMGFSCVIKSHKKSRNVWESRRTFTVNSATLPNNGLRRALSVSTFERRNLFSFFRPYGPAFFFYLNLFSA